MLCASPPTPRSGRNGLVGDYTGSVFTQFSRVRNWNLTSITNPETRYYSGTRFAPQRINGFTNHTGTFGGFGVTPPLFAGDLFTFIGYTAPTTGVPCTPGCAYHVDAIVDSLTLTWNWTAENRTANWSIAFSSLSDVTEIDNFDPPCDDDIYCDDNPCDLPLSIYDCEDTEVDWCNIVSAVLTFTASNVQYSNNTTNCQIVKDAGNLDFTLEIVDQNPCIILTLQDDYWFQLGATSTTNWIIKYAKHTGLTDFNVNIETGEIISKSNNFMMQAVNCCVPETPVRGSIVTPGGLTVWPYSTPS